MIDIAVREWVSEWELIDWLIDCGWELQERRELLAAVLEHRRDASADDDVNDYKRLLSEARDLVSHICTHFNTSYLTRVRPHRRPLTLSLSVSVYITATLSHW